MKKQEQYVFLEIEKKIIFDNLNFLSVSKIKFWPSKSKLNLKCFLSISLKMKIFLFLSISEKICILIIDDLLFQWEMNDQFIYILTFMKWN